MRNFIVPMHRGWMRRSGKRAGQGALLEARNSRYLAGDATMSLWAVLGRALFGPPLGAAADAGDQTPRTIFPAYFDPGEPASTGSVIVVHRGSSMFEAPLGTSGAFVRVPVAGNDRILLVGGVGSWTGRRRIQWVPPSVPTAIPPVPRGIPAAYRGANQVSGWYYPIGRNGDSGFRTLLVRQPNGWFLAGHLRPTSGFDVTPTGSGSFASSTEVRYTIRIYDELTDTESQHGDVISVPTFAAKALNTLTFTSGVQLRDKERGTHVRIYRTLLNEPPGIYYRIDPLMVGYVEGKGIPLTIAVGTAIADSASNTQAQLSGTVRSDGQEGTLAWAEHGGSPPPCGGVIRFGGHLVYYDIWRRPGDLLYSAPGYPECIPVDFDGEPVYVLRIDSDQQDRVLRCTRAGAYLLVLCERSVHRVLRLPTFTSPGFESPRTELISTTNGVAGRFAAANFGVGPEQSWHTVYLSREAGLMFTDGIMNRPVIEEGDVRSLIEPAAMGEVEIVDYPAFQELWMYYQARGASPGNNTALIINYSDFERRGLRMTGPVDVRAVAGTYVIDNSGNGHVLILDSAATVFVQDQGDIDAQVANGNIRVRAHVGRMYPRGTNFGVRLSRAMLYARSPSVRDLTIMHRAVHARESWTIATGCKLGPDGVDVISLDQSGQGFEIEMEYNGPTGSHYREGEAGCAPALTSLEYEIGDAGRLTGVREA